MLNLQNIELLESLALLDKEKLLILPESGRIMSSLNTKICFSRGSTEAGNNIIVLIFSYL